MALYLNWSWMVLNNAGNNFSILRMILICECFSYLVCLEPFKRFSEEKRSRLKNVNMIVNLSPDLFLSLMVYQVYSLMYLHLSPGLLVGCGLPCGCEVCYCEFNPSFLFMSPSIQGPCFLICILTFSLYIVVAEMWLLLYSVSLC